jgi:hypothetical protein
MSIDYTDSLDVIKTQLDAGAKAAYELGEIRATLLVNFGAERRWAYLCDLGDGDGQSTLALMMRVLESIPEVREAKS